jgi:hypothetical protein
VVDDEPLEEEHVLLVDRSVEAELVRHARDVLGRRGLPGREPRGVGGQEEEEDVGDERHSDEEDAGPQESSNEVLEHWSVAPSGEGRRTTPPRPRVAT